MAEEEETGDWGGTDPAAIALNAMKYAEEDVDDVKASWEDEDEEPVAPVVDSSASTSKKKADKKKVEENGEPEKDLTEEERKQAQLDADLALAKETFGITDEDLVASGIDQLKPKSAEDFKELQRRMMLKMADLKKSKHFPDFVSDLIKSLCQEVTLDTSKRISKEVMAHVQALEKFEKEKEKKKPKGKVALKKMRAGDELEAVDDFAGGADFVEEDDFM